MKNNERKLIETYSIEEATHVDCYGEVFEIVGIIDLAGSDDCLVAIEYFDENFGIPEAKLLQSHSYSGLLCYDKD